MARSKKTDDVKKPANPVGRPSIYHEKLPIAIKYINEGWIEFGDVVPSVAGLSCYLGVNRETCYEWASKNPEFSNILKDLMAIQERSLLNGSLNSKMNSTISKLMLTKHNYSDKVEQDVKSSDGSMTPKSTVYKIVNE